MSRMGSVFIREVNVALGGMLVAAIVLAGAHYVSVVHEVRQMRQELCAAHLALLTARNPFLKLDPPPADPCAALTNLTGQQAASVPVYFASWRKSP